MAGSKITRGRLRGSTIMEVIVALVILMIVFGIALSIFGNVSASSLSVQKIKARCILQDVLIMTIKTGNYESGESSPDGLKITKEIKAVDSVPDLLLLHLTALDGNGVKIAELNQLISSNHEKR